MGIFPNRQLNQIAVYWGSPVKDGEGGFTWDAPIEISCRWNDFVKTMLSGDGKEFVSQAKVQVDRDVVKNGMLFLGELDDLDSSVEADPSTGTDTFIIRDFQKSPNIRQTDFFRRAFL